jgi:LAS superfamily LD-carboxypeptidase LdcB
MLNPEVARRMNAILAAVRRRGIAIRVTSTYRSTSSQDRLHRAWLARGKTGLPAARPGLSTHEYGVAFDASWAPQYDKAVADIARQHGMVWFGPKDRVHFDAFGPTKWNELLRAVGLLL